MCPNATRLFRQWGILPAIRERASSPRDITIRNFKTHDPFSVLPIDSVMEGLYTSPYLVMHRADLQEVLAQEAERLGAKIRLNSQIVKHDFSEPSVELSTGEKVKADLILGADGQRSASRDCLAGTHTPLGDSGDHVYRITVDSKNVREREDLADLFTDAPVNVWPGPGIQAVGYPLKRHDLYNIVLICPHEPSEAPLFGPVPVDIAEPRKVFEGWNEKVSGLLELAKDAYKWTLFDPPEAKHWTHAEGMFTLLGDSAHSMPPYM